MRARGAKPFLPTHAYGTIVVEDNGMCLSANASAAKLLGRRDLRKLFIQNVIPLLSSSFARKSFARHLRALDGNSLHFTLQHRGKVRNLEIRCVADILPRKHLILVQDVSGFLENETLIRKQAKLLDLAEDTIMVRDLNDAIVYWNQGAERLYGWSRQEAVGKHVHTFLQTVFPENFDRVRRFFLEHGTWAGILIHTTKRGTEVFVDSRWTLERDELGRPISYLEINNNITERRHAEEELRRAYESLEIRVGERTHELSEANKLLRREIQERKNIENALRDSEARLRALSSRLMNAQEEERVRLSRELHDDLGQILTAIDLDLHRALKSNSDAKRLAFTKQVLQKTAQMRSRIREISLLLRPELLDDVGIREAIENHVSEFAASTGLSVRLDFRCNNNDISAEAATTIYRILQEALNNVSRHATAGSLNIRLSASRKRILLSIQDDGSGFQPSLLSTERALGLIGMKERAQLLGGDFQLSSYPGRGTSIRVRLPRVMETS